MVGERVQAGLGRGRESQSPEQRHGETSAWGLLPRAALLWGVQLTTLDLLWNTAGGTGRPAPAQAMFLWPFLHSPPIWSALGPMAGPSWL